MTTEAKKQIIFSLLPHLPEEAGVIVIITNDGMASTITNINSPELFRMTLQDAINNIPYESTSSNEPIGGRN